MKNIKIHCVGMRDGLQMEKIVVPFETKITWIEQLYKSNIDIIQVGSFVHKEKMPQMADTDELFTELQSRNTKPENTVLSGLVLNERGLDRAMKCGVDMICFGVSASETHSMKNTGMSVNDAVTRIITMAKQAIADGKKIQVSVQSAFGCGFEGDIKEQNVFSIVEKYIEAGIRNISLADTAGFANPIQVERMYYKVFEMSDDLELACHFHNTYGMAIANIYQSLLQGIRVFDSSIAGLGGCPYAKGASGNVSTEDLYYLLSNMGFETGIQLDALMQASRNISEVLQRNNPSNYANAYWQKACA